MEDSASPYTFPGMLQWVLEIQCHLVQSEHLSANFAHCGLLWLLDLLLGTHASSLVPGSTNLTCLPEMQ